jgi:hypothetical protein
MKYSSVVTAVFFAAISVAVAADAVPRLVVWPSSVGFQAGTTGLPLFLRNEGDGTLFWNITSDRSWLAAAPSSGFTTAGQQVAVTVSVDRTGLADGVYSGALSVTSNGGDTAVGVQMVVQEAPKLGAGGGECLLSSYLTSCGFTIQNTGMGLLEWSASSDEPWAVVSPPLSGSLTYGQTHSVRIALDLGSLPSPGETHVAHVTIESNGGTAVKTVRFLPPSSSPGMIGVYADPTGADCNIVATTSGLKRVHIVHSRTDGATASQFSAPKPACWTNAVYLSDVTMFAIAIGNSQTGIAIGYGQCHTGSVHVMSIDYFIQTAPTQFCCPYPVLPDTYAPSGQIEVGDCSFNTVFGAGATAVVNPDASCPCSLPSIAVEETTWGRVKAMYAPE